MLVPLRVGPGSAYTLSIMAIWGLVAVSLVVLTGWAGQISFGQMALAGLGAAVKLWPALLIPAAIVMMRSAKAALTAAQAPEAERRVGAVQRLGAHA